MCPRISGISGISGISISPAYRRHIAGISPALIAALRAAETIGRPLGDPPFLDRLAALVGRDPRPRKRGRKPRRAGEPAG